MIDILETCLREYKELYKPKSEKSTVCLRTAIWQAFTDEWKSIKNNKNLIEMEHGGSSLTIEV